MKQIKQVTFLLFFLLTVLLQAQPPTYIYETTSEADLFDINFIDNRAYGNPKPAKLYNDLDSAEAINYYLREKERAQDYSASLAVESIVTERQIKDVEKELRQVFDINKKDYLDWANNRNSRRLNGRFRYRIQGVESISIFIDSLSIYRRSDSLNIGKMTWYSPRRVEVILFQTNDTLFLNKSLTNNFWFGKDQNEDLHILKQRDTPDDDDTQGNLFFDPNVFMRL